MEKTYTLAEIIRTCEDYADGDRLDVACFLHLLDNPLGPEEERSVGRPALGWLGLVLSSKNPLRH